MEKKENAPGEKKKTLFKKKSKTVNFLFYSFLLKMPIIGKSKFGDKIKTLSLLKSFYQNESLFAACARQCVFLARAGLSVRLAS